MQRINRLSTAQQLPNPILRVERGAAEGTMLPQPLCLKRVRPLLRRGKQGPAARRFLQSPLTAIN